MTSPLIGTLSESSLHADIKTWVAQPGDQLETAVAGFVIDVVHGDTLIEIQTRHLYAMKRKLKKLLPDYSIRLLHPIPQKKWIVRETASGKPISRRKSPKQGRFQDIFAELVRIPHLFAHPNLTLQVLLTHEEEIWRDDGQGSWRRKGWSIIDRHLLQVAAVTELKSAFDLLALLPADLPRPFSNSDIAQKLTGSKRARTRLAQQMTYTLRQLGAIEVVGKSGNSHLHEIMRADE